MGTHTRLHGLYLGQRHSIPEVKQAITCVVEIHAAEERQNKLMRGLAYNPKDYLVFLRLGFLGHRSERSRQPGIDLAPELRVPAEQAARHHCLREHVTQWGT